MITAGAVITLLLVAVARDSVTNAVLGLVPLIALCVVLALGVQRSATTMVVVGVFCAPMTGLTLPGGASFVTVSDLLMFLGFGLLIPSLLHTRVQLTWPFLGGAILLFLTSIVSSLLAADPGTSLNLLIRVMIALVGLPILFAWWAPRDRVLTHLAIAYVAGLCFNVVYAVFISGPSPTSAGRYAGLAETPTVLGYSSILALSLLPFIWAVIARERRWLVGVAAAVCVYGIWIAGSRTGLVVLAALLLIYPVIERSVKVALALIFLSAVLAANLGRLTSSDSSNALSRLLGGTGSTQSDDARISGLTNALDVFKAHPLFGGGYTFDNFLAHNLYVQVAACAGVIGVGAFLALLWGCVAPIFRAERPWGLLAYPALAYVVAGPITPNLGSRYVTVVLGLALILNSRDFARESDEPDDTDGPEPVGAITSPGVVTIRGGR